MKRKQEQQEHNDYEHWKKDNPKKEWNFPFKYAFDKLFNRK